MWKVGDTCWILNHRGVLRKAVVVAVTEWKGVNYVRKVRTVGGVYCNPWQYDKSPEPLIDWIREHAARQLQWAEGCLETAQRNMQTLESDIQAMLDAALEGE